MESSAFTGFLSRYYRFPKLFLRLAASLKGMASSNKCLKTVRGSRNILPFPGQFHLNHTGNALWFPHFSYTAGKASALDLFVQACKDGQYCLTHTSMLLRSKCSVGHLIFSVFSSTGGTQLN